MSSAVNAEQVDSLLVHDSIAVESSDAGVEIPGRVSPMGALLRSAAVPGWGQFYNKKYVKAFVVMVGESYLVYRLAYNWDLADQAFDRFSAESDPGIRNRYYLDYEFYQDRRDLFMWLTGVTVFLSMIDAYVDAHLSGFDIDVTPPFDEPGSGVAMVTLTYRF
jgi:hypothetical protein